MKDDEKGRKDAPRIQRSEWVVDSYLTLYSLQWLFESSEVIHA